MNDTHARLPQKASESAADWLEATAGQSMSDPAEDDSQYDRLFCTERQEYVEEDGICAAYNQ